MAHGTQVTFHWRDTVLDTVHLAPGETTAVGPVTVEIEEVPSRIDRDGLVIRATPSVPIERPRRVARADWDVARVFAISGLAHVFFVAFAFVTPAPRPFELAALRRGHTVFRDFAYKKPAPEKPPTNPLAGIRDAGRHKDIEGLFGLKGKTRDAASSKDRGRSDRDIAKSAGLLGLLAKGGLDSVLGSGGLGGGINEALGGLRGAEFGDARGLGGMGTRGSGSGGGGRSIGIGGIGVGDGRGPRGGADIDLGGRGKRRHVHFGGRVVLSEGLSKEDVGRVVRRNLRRFRHCYEKELNANPNLRGRVGVRFTIAPTGSVADARIQESDLGSPAVERCVTGVMRTLKFPKPRGGGVVIVSYPFMMDAI